MRWHIALLAALFTAGLFGCRNDASSLRQLQSAVRSDPGSVEARVALGDAYYEAGDLHDSFIQFSTAHSIAPDSYPVLYGLARAQEALGDSDAALERATEAVELNPEGVEALNLQARLLLADEPGRAAAILERALKFEPTNEEALKQLSIAYLRDERIEAANAAAKRAAESLPQSAEAQMNLALVKVAQNQSAEAERLLRKAMELEPSNAEAPLRLAELFVRDGRKLEEAVELADKSSQLDPGDGNPEALAAIALRRLDRNEEAVRRLHTAATAYPRNIRLWLMLSSAYGDLGDEEAAAQAATMAYRFAPRRAVRDREDPGPLGIDWEDEASVPQ
jgi:tetratricopeptide (TPR) repeat protein